MTPSVQNFSNGAKDKEPQGSYGGSQLASSKTRTKTVSFSQNGYPEQLLKVDHHLRALGTRKDYEQSQQEKDSLPPPGFDFKLERINSNHINQTGLNSKGHDGQLRTIGYGLSEHSDPLCSSRHG